VLWGVYVALRGKAWLFRALAMTVLAIALANPQWIQEQREPLKDIVAVVMDRSESMNFRGRTETAQAAYDAIRERDRSGRHAGTAHRREPIPAPMVRTCIARCSRRCRMRRASALPAR